MIYALLVTIFLLLSLYHLVNRPCIQHGRTTCAMVKHARSRSKQKPIPKLIWSYWHEEDQPLLVKKCIDNWRRYNKDYTINILHSGNLAKFIIKDQLPGDFSKLKEFRKADWLRVALLRTYGGIWLDASTFLTRSLDWVMELQQKNNSEFVGFYIDGFSTDKDSPIIENWFLASAHDSRFIADWYSEFTNEVISRNERDYLKMLRDSGAYIDVVQNIKHPEYLAMHVAASRITRKKEEYSLTLLRAEETAFFYLHQFKWSRSKLFIQLALLKANSSVPSIIKFRARERSYFERGLKYKIFRSSSVVGRYLMRESIS